MTARRQAVRFWRERTTRRGDRVRQYWGEGGRLAEVVVRHGRRGERFMTNAEAKKVATWRLIARPGSIRFDRRWTNDFTGLSFDRYENTDGRQEDVPVQTGGFLSRGRNRTRAETRVIAERCLRGVA